MALMVLLFNVMICVDGIDEFFEQVTDHLRIVKGANFESRSLITLGFLGGNRWRGGGRALAPSQLGVLRRRWTDLRNIK